MGSIIYIVGVVLSVLAVLDIIKKPISVVGKIITAVLPEGLLIENKIVSLQPQR